MIILASTSPRRRLLMKKLGVKFRVVNANYQEKKHKHMKPEQLVEFLALGKAKAAAKRFPNAIVIGADTMVVFKEHVLGKPKNRKDAKRILNMLSGKANYILTGLAVISPVKNKVVSLVRETKVVFKKYSEKTVDEYIKTGEPMDKAGAYAIQGFGKKLVKKVVGDRDSGIGLPVKDLKRILKKLGVIKK